MTESTIEQPKRKGGRPKGSKNKSRKVKQGEVVATSGYIKSIDPQPVAGSSYSTDTQTLPITATEIGIEMRDADLAKQPQGHYDRKAAFSGAMVYQVVSHTRDAIRVLGPKGTLAAMIYRRSPVPGTNGEQMDHPFAEIAARELCEFLNKRAEELR